jgi:hypothetical protein
MKATTIYDKHYRQEFVWVHAKTAKEFSDYLRSKISNFDEVVDTSEDTDEEYEGETLNLTVDGAQIIFFWFKKSDPTAIVHELLHATFKCMRSRGITLSEESEEAFCYMQSYLYEEVLAVINKKSLDKKQKS